MLQTPLGILLLGLLKLAARLRLEHALDLGANRALLLSARVLGAAIGVHLLARHELATGLWHHLRAHRHRARLGFLFHDGRFRAVELQLHTPAMAVAAPSIDTLDGEGVASLGDFEFVAAVSVRKPFHGPGVLGERLGANIPSSAGDGLFARSGLGTDLEQFRRLVGLNSPGAVLAVGSAVSEALLCVAPALDASLQEFARLGRRDARKNYLGRLRKGLGGSCRLRFLALDSPGTVLAVAPAVFEALHCISAAPDASLQEIPACGCLDVGGVLHNGQSDAHGHESKDGQQNGLVGLHLNLRQCTERQDRR